LLAVNSFTTFSDFTSSQKHCIVKLPLVEGRFAQHMKMPVAGILFGHRALNVMKLLITLIFSFAQTRHLQVTDINDLFVYYVMFSTAWYNSSATTKQWRYSVVRSIREILPAC